MVAIPFIYFSLLTCFLWRQAHTFGIASFMAALYAFSGFFSILIDHYGLYGINVAASPEDVTFVPTLLYCALITLLILPFQQVVRKPPQQIVLKDERLFNLICVVYMALLILAVLLMFRGVSTVLQGDLQEMKVASRTADGIAAKTRGGIAFYLNYVADFSFFLLPFFFFSLCFLRRHWLFNALLFGATLMRVFMSLLSVDRSRPLFWIYMAVFSLLFFRPFLSKEQKRVLGIGAMILAYLLATYLFVVTVARFHYRSTGTSGGFIAYAGQSFVHFCHYYHNYAPVYSLYRICPLLYSPVLENGVTLQWQYYLQTGIATNVFTSVLGVFYADLGLIGMMSLVLLLHFLFKLVMNKVAQPEMTFPGLLVMYAMAIVPLWGNITYWYNVRPRMMTLVYCLLVVFAMRVRGASASVSSRRRMA